MLYEIEQGRPFPATLQEDEAAPPSTVVSQSQSAATATIPIREQAPSQQQSTATVQP